MNKTHHPQNRLERLKIKALKEHSLKNKHSGLRKTREIIEEKELEDELRREVSGS